MIDPIIKLGKNYYLQTFLEEWKYRIKVKEIPYVIRDDLKRSSNDGFEEKNEEDFDENFSNL